MRLYPFFRSSVGLLLCPSTSSWKELCCAFKVLGMFVFWVGVKAERSCGKKSGRGCKALPTCLWWYCCSCYLLIAFVLKATAVKQNGLAKEILTICWWVGNYVHTLSLSGLEMADMKKTEKLVRAYFFFQRISTTNTYSEHFLKSQQNSVILLRIHMIHCTGCKNCDPVIQCIVNFFEQLCQ